MATHILITQLRPGMRIEKPDRSRFETLLFRHRMAVTSMEQVEQLQACGVDTLDVSGEVNTGTTLALTDPVSTGIHSTTYLDQELS
jgi:hypothetical protein